MAWWFRCSRSFRNLDPLLLTHPLNGLLMVAIPVGLAILLQRRFRLGWRLWGIGVATFVLSQVGHIPFNLLLTNLFQNGTLPPPPSDWRPYFNPVVLGLSAGLWEELSRTAVLLWWARDARSWRKGVWLGAGHGGIEAILLGLYVLYTFIQLAALRGADLSTLVPPDRLALAQQQVQTYWSIPWPLTLMGALERALTIPVQISLSVLVMRAFLSRQPGWVALAVFYHALVDAVCVYTAGIWGAQPWGVYAIEGVLAGFTLLSIIFIFTLRRPSLDQPDEPAPPPSAPLPAPLTAADLQPREEEEVSGQKLDDSRFL